MITYKYNSFSFHESRLASWRLLHAAAFCCRDDVSLTLIAWGATFNEPGSDRLVHSRGFLVRLLV